MPQIVGGRLTVSGDGGSLVDAIGSALGVELRSTFSEPDDDTEYYGGSLLGLRFTVTIVGHRSDAAYELSYLAEDDAYVSGATLVSLDFHLERLLAAAGLTAKTKP
ncbi:hypothetical protein [Cellulomonas sp. URHD0024]|uniref:hypothetical protein n=1 Tax=Cellulomonas sp. URHD0024 TaxID=1302620 RepID=UPI0003FE9863|nr:hypothetical protein [Cellulomonas sp. URHD0024]